MNQLKQGDTIWFLPCPIDKNTNNEKKGSSFGGTLTSNPTSLGRSISSTAKNNGESLVSNEPFAIDYTHNFHQACLQEWFDQGKNECPVCQNAIRAELWINCEKLDKSKAGLRRMFAVRESTAGDFKQDLTASLGSIKC